MIFDNHPLFQIFLSRYQNIKEQYTDNFIPESLLEKYKATDSKEIFVINEQQKSEILTEELLKDRDTLLLSQEELEGIQSIPNIIYEEQQKLDTTNNRENKINERTIKTISLMLGNKNGSTEKKNPDFC